MTEGSYPSLGYVKEAIDLTINEPRVIDKANCIKARYDASIVNFKADGTGVIETVIMKNMIDKNLEPDAKIIDVACTLMARDWKGINNYGSNGVITNGGSN